MGLLRKRTGQLTSVKIKRSLVEGLLEVSRELHPKEFIALLRARKGVIAEVVVPPFSVYGIGESSFPLHELPIDMSLVGSVHSHPSGDPRPSKQDLNVAFTFGLVHLIISYPYAGIENVHAYDKDGNPLKLVVVD